MPAPAVTTPAPHKFTILAVLGGLVLFVELARLVVFMAIGDPIRGTGWSVTPWNAFITRHACTTAYWGAATGVDQKPDVYQPSNYLAGRDPATGRAIERQIGAYPIDPYEYPPTFLLLPRLLTPLTPEFTSFHRLWAVLNVFVVIGGVVVVARRVDRANSGRSLWLVPLALLPLGIISTFQTGNAQLLFVVIAMLAMLAFEQRRPAIGGLLLAYAIVGKLFPGLLLVYLVVRRDWRAVAWTAAWGAALSLVALANVGWAPFAHFLDHLPGLLSGEAFPMLRVPGPPNISLSVPGIVLKLPAFGAPALPFVSLKIAGWIFTAIIVSATVRLALRPVAARLAPLAWLAVLGLATLRSPFLPGYGVFQGVWIASIVLAVCWADRRRRLWALGLWLLLLPTTAGPAPVPPWVVATGTTIQTIAVLALVGLAVQVGREAATKPLPTPAIAT
jgi:hypothetical protein